MKTSYNFMKNNFGIQMASFKPCHVKLALFYITILQQTRTLDSVHVHKMVLRLELAAKRRNDPHRSKSTEALTRVSDQPLLYCSDLYKGLSVFLMKFISAQIKFCLLLM